MNKTCIKCGEVKPIGEYHKGKNQCKACKAEYDKQYRQDNKEHRKQYNKQYYQDNKEAINFYKAVGYNEDEVISYGKRLIED